jgi:hypothetical protein
LPPIELWRHAFAFCGQVAPLAQRSELVARDVRPLGERG